MAKNTSKIKMIFALFMLIVFQDVNVANGAAPIFDHFPTSIYIPESKTFGDVIWSCNATDADDPSTPEGQIRYEFNTQVARPKWLLDSRSCVMYVYTGLDYEGQQSYTLRIIVKDLHPTAPQTSTGTLTIHVTDVNDNSPLCEEYFVVLNVQEDEAINTEIAKSVCSDGDRDKSTNGQVLYKIADSNDVEVKSSFEIYPDGAILLKKQLDYEVSPSYVLKIDVYDNAGAASLTTSITYNIEVKDVDDNKPTWPTNPYIQSVPESTNLDAAVFSLTANDADKPFTDASSITYGIQTPAVPDWFNIDSKTGAVSVKGILNYNIAPWVTMEVFAYSSDKSTDTSVLLVNISLIDENTIAPTFQQISYLGNITENVPTGTSIVTVSATDPEAGVNGQVEYHLASSEFIVDPITGVVTTQSSIDFESKSIYSLQIEARDKGSPNSLSGYGFLIVNVLAENEFDPVLSGPSSPIDIPEDTEPGFIIVNITATDQDSGFDGIVTFSIVDGLAPFTIEPTTGILRVGSNLDREQQSEWEITVMATDLSETSPRNASISVHVNLEDVNDNTPICEPLPNVVVRLPHIINGVLASINCDDFDEGVNSELIYSKISGDSLDSFDVDSVTGKITLASSPTETEYFIHFRISDKGNPPRNVILVFHVIAELQFKLKNLPNSITVEENTDLAKELFDVNDCCVFSLTSYEILSGNEDNHVIIDPASGKIILMRSFDRETKDNFRYEIQARSVETNTTAKDFIDVSISDSNDNTPTFDTSFQYISVLENISPSDIRSITATDADIGTNADLTYAITAGNDDGVFDIDQSGTLKLLSSLDAETVNKYSLTITSTDGGSPALSSSTILDIEVKNINDFSPQLVNVTGTVTKNVSEDLALGAPIFTLSASDEDLNTVFTYGISQGNDEDTFLIDSASGSIYLAKLLDRETVDQYNLTADAVNQDNETVSAHIVVNVLDINDNDPKFSQDLYQLEVIHEEPPSTSLTSFLITDKDIGLNKDIASLTIVDGDSGNHFKIVGYEIQTNVKMDYYNRKLYTLTVQALDTGASPRSGFARVVIKVLPIFKPPLFYAGDYSETIREDINLADNVKDLDATLQGGTEGDSGTIKYSIRSGNDDKQFYITAYSGQVKVASNLDFETIEQYILTIDAFSREDPNLSASTTVTIDVENVNDNFPVFNQNIYTFTADEDAGIGDTVGTVLATDLDKPPYNTLYYSLGTSSGSNDLSLDSATGIIKVNQDLDYRRQNVYNIPVFVGNDAGVMQGEALVVVKINDVNDNAPTFTPDTVNIEVVESVGTGLTFYTVKAEDLDTGIHGEIKYTLVSGNFDNQLSLDPDSGALTVVSNLDREAHDRFDLVIRAEDKGSPSALSGTLSLTVNVADVNDQDPDFPKTLEDATVDRTASPGTIVKTVIATDKDIGDNGVVTYEITSGNTDGLFIIGLNSGEIKIASSVTLAENEYELEITAKDRGIPVRTDTMTVKVVFTPAKVFGPSEQEMQLYEGLSPGSVGVVTPKSGHANVADIKFEIVKGNFKNNFDIGLNDGSLSATSTLDREEYPTYILSIQISDNNGVSYIKTVTISVLDINDNDPVIMTNNNNINVVENTPAGQILTDFTVTDEDSGDNGKFDLEVASTPADAFEYFEITDYFLRLKKPLDYETKPSFTVTVIAKDRGSPPRSSTITVTVTVIDIKDSVTIINGPPELPSIFISRETSYNSPNEAKVTELTSEDFGKTSGSTTFTSINREGIFAVGLDGTVRVQKAELLEAETSYYVWIVARTETSTNTSNTLGLLRIDTFDPNLHVVSIESSLDVPTLQSKRSEIINNVKIFFAANDEPKIWNIQSYEVSARRKLLAAGSQILIYVIKNASSDVIGNFESIKNFMLMETMLNALRMEPNQDAPQPSLNTASLPVVAVNGYSEPVLPKTENLSQSEDFVTSLEGYITFAVIGFIFLLILLILVILYLQKKKKHAKRTNSSENLVYTDPNTNSKKVALVIPTGLGKNTNNTTRRVSLGPASTSLPLSKSKKKSTAKSPLEDIPQSTTVLTPVQSATEDKNPAPPILETHKDSKEAKSAKRTLPPLRNPREPADISTRDLEKDLETKGSHRVKKTSSTINVSEANDGAS